MEPSELEMELYRARASSRILGKAARRYQDKYREALSTVARLQAELDIERNVSAVRDKEWTGGMRSVSGTLFAAIGDLGGRAELDSEGRAQLVLPDGEIMHLRVVEGA